MPERLDFKAIAENVDIEAVAQHLGLSLSKDGRSECPACNSKDRALEIIPETNTFRCWAHPPPGKKCVGGDAIGLVAHVKGYQGMYRAAKELAEVFGVGGTVTSTSTVLTNSKNQATSPPAREQATAARVFDPQAFLQKLVFSPEVEALGLDQANAERLGWGYHPQRKMLYLAAKNGDGSIAGFVGIKDPQTLKLPPKWLAPSNVVQLKRA